METVNQRIKETIEALGFTSLNAFDKVLGVPRNTTVCYVGDRQVKPGPDYFKKFFLKFPNVDTRWVMTGEGEMFTSEKLRREYIENLEKRLEIRDRDARRLETALDIASNRSANFQSVSERTPGVKKVNFYEKYLEKVA